MKLLTATVTIQVLAITDEACETAMDRIAGAVAEVADALRIGLPNLPNAKQVRTTIEHDVFDGKGIRFG